VTSHAQREDVLQSAAAGSGSSRADARASASRRRARQYQRVAVRCGCWLEHQDATVFGTTVDIGRGGLFLRTALPMAPGMDVRVTLKLPGLDAVVAEGQVVHRVSPQAGDRPGLGVRFDQVSVGDESLRDFLGLTLLKDAEAEQVG
jgi:uncharacterized protein (TIGR02266 family)